MATSEGTSYTDDELNLISQRAAEIQAEFRAELRNVDKKKYTFRKNSRSDSERSLPAIPQTAARGATPSSEDLRELNDLISSRVKEITGKYVTESIKRESANESSSEKPGNSRQNLFQGERNQEQKEERNIDEALQKSLEAIKRKLNLTYESESNGSDSSLTPRNLPVCQPQSAPELNLSQDRYFRDPTNERSFYEQNNESFRIPQSPITTINQGTANISQYLDEHDQRRKVDLLKYELEAEQQASMTKITVLTEELKTAKQLLEASNSRNEELNQEISVVGQKLREEMAHNHELNKTLKTQVAALVSQVDEFKKVEKDFEYKFEEKQELVEALKEMLEEKEDELENLRETYGKQLAMLRSNMEEAKRNYEKNCRNMSESHQVELQNTVDSLNKQHENAMKQARGKFADEKSNYEDEISQLRVKMREREQEFDSQFRRQKSDFEERLSATINQERECSETNQQDALRRQEMKFEDEIATIKKRLNDELTFERTRCLEAERAIESLKKELSQARDDTAALQRESVEAIKQTQKACEASADMKLTELRDEMGAEHAEAVQRLRSEMHALTQDKQTADIDIERLNNKIAEMEEQKKKEQRKTIVRINRSCSEIASSIGIQPRSVYVGEEEELASMNFDQLVKTGLDNLTSTSQEVLRYVTKNMNQVQSLREQFKAYQTEKDLELSDIRHHFEAETGRMVEFTKDRLYKKYLQEMDEMKREIKKDQDVETLLRKTVDRQSEAIKGMRQQKCRKGGKIIDSDLSSDAATDRRIKHNLRNLQKLNSRVHNLNAFPVNE